MVTRTVLEELLGRLDGVRGSGSSFTAMCPAHCKRGWVLWVNQSTDGEVLLRCAGGCDPSAILRRIGMKMSDIRSEQEDGGEEQPAPVAPPQPPPPRPQPRSPDCRGPQFQSHRQARSYSRRRLRNGDGQRGKVWRCPGCGKWHVSLPQLDDGGGGS